jgi:predicted DNA-binding transcriptional regulator YafY
MGSKPGTLETLQFTLELLKRIPRTHKISAPELYRQLTAAGWQRDLRTVQRQLDELSQQFDIEKDDRSKPYGYQWKPQAQGLSVPALTETESLLLALAEEHLRSLLPAEVLASMQPFFRHARSTLSGAKSGSAAREWMQKVRVVSTSQPLLPPRIAADVLEAVSTGLYRNRLLDIDYSNSSGKRVSACVMPLGLAQQGSRLYLVCRFRGYDNERSLALNRIRSATLTPHAFTRPADFDLAKYDDEGRFGFGSGKKVRLSILIDKPAGAHLLESKLSQDQEVTENGDQYRIRATVTETEQLKWWLRGFGPEVTVLSPKRIAQQVHPVSIL